MRITVTNAEDIRKFLKGDYKILDVVLESEKIISSIFGDVPLKMKMSSDRECVFIEIKYNGKDAFTKMDKFDRWFNCSEI